MGKNSEMGFPGKHFLYLIFALTGLALAVPTSAAAQEAVGGVVFLRGAAQVRHGDSTRDLSRGSEISEGDEIVTGADTRIVLKMIDGATINLGADSRFEVWRYEFDAAGGGGKAALGLVKGAFRAITGAIGDSANADIRVVTPVATLGVRGTDFWGGFSFGEALDVALLDGKGIWIENEAGRVEITDAGFGTTIHSATTAPTAPNRWGDEKLRKAAEITAAE